MKTLFLFAIGIVIGALAVALTEREDIKVEADEYPEIEPAPAYDLTYWPAGTHYDQRLRSWVTYTAADPSTAVVSRPVLHEGWAN